MIAEQQDGGASLRKIVLPIWKALGSLIPGWLSGMGVFGQVACVVVALLGTEALQLWWVYDANRQQSATTTSNIARLVAEQTGDVLSVADRIADQLAKEVESGNGGAEDLARLYALMSSLVAALPEIHEIGVTDSQGNALLETLASKPVGLNYAERAYFRFHATHPGQDSFVGPRIKSKIDGSYNITVTRRINRPDGSFGGVVAVSLPTEYFRSAFEQMRGRTGDVIELLTDDDTILARAPPLAGDTPWSSGGGRIGQEMRNRPRAGGIAYTSSIDGIERFGSYQRLAQFPLTALVSQSEWDLQRRWRTELGWHALILACVIMVGIVLGTRAKRADQLLKLQAMQDGLTGLANRRFFNETVEREFRRAMRSSSCLSIIMLDIDYFKMYNDCYGHQAGDECLRAVASTIRGCLRREGEVAARYGGEEIALILPGSDSPSAYALAARIRVAVRGLGLRHARSSHGIVTFSAGVATWIPGRTSIGWDALLGMADEALYEAKASGRDSVRVCTAQHAKQAA